VVHYDEVAARNGCAVDILMKDKPANKNKILFAAEVKVNKRFDECLTACRETFFDKIPVPSDHNMSVSTLFNSNSTF
jgi:hypothetical protein